MCELNFSSLLQAALCQSRGKDGSGAVKAEMVTASSSLSSFICYCLSSDFHIHLAKLLTGGASSPGNGQAVPRTGELWTNALSLTRKSSPVSVSSAEPKKCQSVWPVFQFKSSQRANEL